MDPFSLAPLKLCAVSYLNTAPLVWGLLHGSSARAASLSFGVPAACADAVREGRADGGLLPVVEIARQKLTTWSDVGIACQGAVRSILLVTKRPPQSIRRLATDSSSRTSAMLCRILLTERYAADPEPIPAAPNLDRMLEIADAALLIGDPALRLDPATLPYQTLDLGEEWWTMTGLPMVFAAWAGRGDASSRLFRQSYEQGRAELERYLPTEASKRSIPVDLAREYLTRFIRYELGPAEERGRDEYLRLASRLETIAA